MTKVYILFNFFLCVGTLLAQPLTALCPIYGEYNEELLTDKEFENLETSEERQTAIVMMMNRECCSKSLEKALSYCQKWLEDLKELKDIENGDEACCIASTKHDLCILAARICIELGDFDTANGMIDIASEDNVITPSILIIKGDLNIIRGDIREAKRKYEEAWAGEPYDLQTAHRLYTCSKLGLQYSDTKGIYKQDDPLLRTLRRANIEWKKKEESFTPNDPLEIFVLYPSALEAAHAGVPSAMMYLHKVYTSGCGIIKQDTARAQYWLMNAERLTK